MEYIIAKKNENSRKLKEYERLKKKEDESNLDKATAETNQKVEQFLKGENSIISKTSSPFKAGKWLKICTFLIIKNILNA